jgi:serine/threonine protein kinase
VRGTASRTVLVVQILAVGSCASTIVEKPTRERLGKYTLIRPLAMGGMAELFLARTDGLGGFSKQVVVKRILPHRASDARFIRMLLDEACLVASLDHPNIAHVYDIGYEGGEYFFAMEYVEGCDVRQILKHLQGPLSLEQAIYIAMGVCTGLHFAHQARDAQGRPLGIVHRDINPGNVIVSYEGAIKIVDFGIAQAASIAADSHGTIKGTFGYLSPEQASGIEVDHRSDVFSLGVMLWEMTVGQRLYHDDHSDLGVLQMIVEHDAPRPSKFIANYPADLELIVMRALARNRDARYHSAQELYFALEAFAMRHQLRLSPLAMSQGMQRMFRGRADSWVEEWHAEPRSINAPDGMADLLESLESARPLARGSSRMAAESSSLAIPVMATPRVLPPPAYVLPVLPPLRIEPPTARSDARVRELVKRNAILALLFVGYFASTELSADVSSALAVPAPAASVELTPSNAPLQIELLPPAPAPVLIVEPAVTQHEVVPAATKPVKHKQRSRAKRERQREAEADIVEIIDTDEPEPPKAKTGIVWDQRE